MTSGFGVDPAADGSSGTSSQDIRKIMGALYAPGVVNGCQITTSASAMSYIVAAGVVAIKAATGETILAPVPAVTVPTSSAPATGSRTDIVYAQQRYPSIEGDANIVVGVGTVLPARAVVLGRFIVSAGNANTNATVRTGNVDYSIPYGASLGVLHRYQDTTQGVQPDNLIRKGHGTIYLPTDRRLRFSISAVLNANNAVGFDNSRYCEFGFLPNIDGGDFVLWATSGLHQAVANYSFESYINANAGTHTVMYGQLRKAGPGSVVSHYGQGGDGFGREGIIFTVEDAGPAL